MSHLNLKNAVSALNYVFVYFPRINEKINACGKFAGPNWFFRFCQNRSTTLLLSRVFESFFLCVIKSLLVSHLCKTDISFAILSKFYFVCNSCNKRWAFRKTTFVMGWPCKQTEWTRFQNEDGQTKSLMQN